MKKAPTKGRVLAAAKKTAKRKPAAKMPAYPEAIEHALFRTGCAREQLKTLDTVAVVRAGRVQLTAKQKTVLDDAERWLGDALTALAAFRKQLWAVKSEQERRKA